MVRNTALVFLVVFITRLPFLGPGFGADADAWRIAGAARDIARTNTYVASRFPGAPVVEIADSLLLRLGPWTLPVASALWGAIGCAAFYAALCRLGARGCLWAALALGFTPVFWIHTTDAMDYAWALGLGLVGLALAVHGRPTFAGIAIGLSIGCRLPSAAFLVPVGFLLVGSRSRYVVAAALAGALALAPSFLTYGTRFLSGYEFGPIPWLWVVKGATRDVWGVIGSVAVVVGLVFAAPRIRVVPKREVVAIVAAVLLFGAIYLRLPHDGAYLLPVVPFVLLLFARTLPGQAVAALACGLVLSSLLVGVVEGRHPHRPSMTFKAMGRQIGVEWTDGPLLQERARRVEGVTRRDAFVALVRRFLPTNSIVMVYEQLPLFQWVVPPGSPGPEFVHLLAPAAAAQAREQGRPIYATEDAIANEWTIYRVRAEELGVQSLETGW